MLRSSARVLICALLLFQAGRARAFDVPATIEKVDADKGIIVFTARGQQRTARVAHDALFVGRDGKSLASGLRSDALNAGARVTISVEAVDGKPVVKGIRLGESAGAATKAPAPALPPLDTSRLVALTDMGPSGTYHEQPGGLYPNGSDRRPEAHEQAGLALAATIRPLDSEGKPAPDGKIGLLAIGFSNTLQCFNGLMQVVTNAHEINPRVVLVNGAQGGRSAFMIQKLGNAIGDAYWKEWVPEHLKARGVSPAQVQVVWLKETDANIGPAMLRQLGVDAYQSPLRMGFPAGARTLQGELERIVQLIHEQFPNVKLVYLSSRSYGGWAKREGNREPFSYETGYAVKWLIADQLSGKPSLNFDSAKGEVKAPWLSWGPYLWANGEIKRHDGFAFQTSDFRDDDQMHHSPAGMRKMGQQLLQFFETDSTTKGWFVKASP